MKKETYLRKLAMTKITDENTVGEAKAAKRIEAELKRFWKKAVLEFLRENETEFKATVNRPWIDVRFDYNLKATGTVVVQLVNTDTRGLLYPPVEKEYRVRKNTLLA